MVFTAAAALVASLALSACGGKDATRGTDSAQKTGTLGENWPESKADSDRRTAGSEGTPDDAGEDHIMIAAAASLKNLMESELIPMFEEKNPGLTVEGTFDSSGKLQTQIEEGAKVDIFFFAAAKQMEALKVKDMVDSGFVVDLLENKIVFIVPSGDEADYKTFEDLTKVETLAIGDPKSVPAGQYAKEALTNLGLWEQVEDSLSLGTNVTEVLNWVAEGSAGGGIVYATDAMQNDKVAVVAQAPADSVKKVVYPVGILKNSEHRKTALKFLDFLQSEESLQIFEEAGFTAIRR